MERLTGLPADDSAKGAAVQRGIDAEASAFRAYEARTGQMVKRAGFLAHDSLAAGSSLDGYVGDFAGILELKCPNSATHLDYLTAGTLPDGYRGQIFHNRHVSGAAWCDFVSYDPRLPEDMQVFIHRLQRDDAEIARLEDEVKSFLFEVDQTVRALTRRYGDKAAA